MIDGIKPNNSKCWIVPLQGIKCGHQSDWGDELLASSLAGRVVGVLVSSRLKRCQPCALAAKRANCILQCIKHHTASWSRAGIILVYSVLVRPHLEHLCAVPGPKI